MWLRINLLKIEWLLSQKKSRIRILRDSVTCVGQFGAWIVLLFRKIYNKNAKLNTNTNDRNDKILISQGTVYTVVMFLLILLGAVDRELFIRRHKLYLEKPLFDYLESYARKFVFISNMIFVKFINSFSFSSLFFLNFDIL